MAKPTFVIAELGINHNGKIDIAKKLIRSAKDSGADAVKFQKRSIDKVYLKEDLDRPRESPWGSTNREQKHGLELSYKDYIEIDKYCGDLGIEWFASAWDMDSAALVSTFDLRCNKIASARLTHIELLEYTAKQGKYTFISTGMSTLEEIGVAVSIFRKFGCPFELIHCNSAYPAKDEDINILCIKSLKDAFLCNIGYSGHSTGIMDCVVAVALGATSVEKHITLDRTMYGTDQSSSLEPQGFRKMVEYIRFTETVLGNGVKSITPVEEAVSLKLRRNSDV